MDQGRDGMAVGDRPAPQLYMASLQQQQAQQRQQLHQQPQQQPPPQNLTLAGSSSSSAMSSMWSHGWFTSKLLEQRFRSACSMVMEAVDGDPKAAADDGLQHVLAEFSTLKNEQVELARLAALYAKQQHALKKTEAELGLLLGNIGVHEPRRNMGSALNLCADMLRRSSKRREDLVVQCEAFSTSIDAFLSTAVEDMQTSKNRFDMTRRALKAAEETLVRSRSAVIDPARRKMLEAEVDESRKLYSDLSVQLSSKVRLLSHHRNRQLCESVSLLCDGAKEHHLAAAADWSAWAPFVPDESDAIAVIEQCFQENLDHASAGGGAVHTMPSAAPPTPAEEAGRQGARGKQATPLHDSNNLEFEAVDLQSGPPSYDDDARRRSPEALDQGHGSAAGELGGGWGGVASAAPSSQDVSDVRPEALPLTVRGARVLYDRTVAASGESLAVAMQQEPAGQGVESAGDYSEAGCADEGYCTTQEVWDGDGDVDPAPAAPEAPGEVKVAAKVAARFAERKA